MAALSGAGFAGSERGMTVADSPSRRACQPACCRKSRTVRPPRRSALCKPWPVSIGVVIAMEPYLITLTTKSDVFPKDARDLRLVYEKSVQPDEPNIRLLAYRAASRNDIPTGIQIVGGTFTSSWPRGVQSAGLGAAQVRRCVMLAYGYRGTAQHSAGDHACAASGSMEQGVLGASRSR
jgi:hypothetical protein